MKRQDRVMSAVAGLLITLTLIVGCASAEISPPIESCHSYSVNSGYGRFSIQQSAKGRSIQWGAYPNATYSGTLYRVGVYANGVKIDSKNQTYAPHGSVSASRATKYSGKILQISGNVTRGKDVVLVFNMQCKIM
ncbi:hypothetical protein LJR045_002495 [Microbacterium sp. LjRoot45]|uniref:hypothetical protein n=1 Tax=Microbacterium sp. LjRoot45 TaxID=3342329 RepID=UPI003ECE6033